MKEIYSAPIEIIKDSSKIVGNIAKKTFEPAVPYWKKSLQKKTTKILNIFSKKTF